MVRGRLQVVGPSFTLDGIAHQVLGATMYSLFFDWAYGGLQSFVTEMMGAMKAANINTPRIFVTVDQDFGWGDGSYTGYPVVLNPDDTPNFYGKLRAFASFMEENGFYPEYVVFGSCVDGFTTQAERNTVCQNVGVVLRGFTCLVEISPDPVNTNLGYEGASITYDPWDEAQRLVTIYKTVDIQNPVAAAGGSFTASEINRPLADFMGYAPDRLIGLGKWEWIMAQVDASPVLLSGNPRAVIAEFPMCAADNAQSDNNDEDPNHWWAFGLLGQFLQVNSMFHSETLLGSNLTESSCWNQLVAWRDGRVSVAWKDYPLFKITDVPSDTIVGDCPWFTTSVGMIVGRHDGYRGIAVGMMAPEPWSPTTGLNAGWRAEIIEQRGDAALVAVWRI